MGNAALARAEQDSRSKKLLTVGAALFLWLVPSLMYIQKYTGSLGLMVLTLLALSAFICLPEIVGRLGPSLARSAVVVLCIVTITFFILLYPIANDGSLDAGSDRDDALNTGLRAVLNGQYPYSVTTYLGNPLTPMPGALVLAFPFFVLGNSAYQNVLWIAIFGWWCLRHFQNPAAALICVAAFILGCPGALGDFVVGGDYLVNAIYVAIAMAAVLWASDREETWCRYAATVFLAVAISSRPIYAIALVVLAGAVFQTKGSRRTLELVSIVTLVSIALNGPFFVYDPSRFPIAQVSGKLSSFPQAVHADFILPSLGMGIAALSFFVTTVREKIFGLMAIALAAMMYPVVIVDIVTSSFDPSSLLTAFYSLPVTLFAGLQISEKLARSQATPAPALSTSS